MIYAACIYTMRASNSSSSSSSSRIMSEDEEGVKAMVHKAGLDEKDFFSVMKMVDPIRELGLELEQSQYNTRANTTQGSNLSVTQRHMRPNDKRHSMRWSDTSSRVTRMPLKASSKPECQRRRPKMRPSGRKQSKTGSTPGNRDSVSDRR